MKIDNKAPEELESLWESDPVGLLHGLEDKKKYERWKELDPDAPAPYLSSNPIVREEFWEDIDPKHVGRIIGRLTWEDLSDEEKAMIPVKELYPAGDTEALRRFWENPDLELLDEILEERFRYAREIMARRNEK